MGSNSTVNLPHFISVELWLWLDNFSNFAGRKTKITRNNPCNISMDAYIMFNGKKLEIF